MTTDITELAQRADRIISEMKLKHGDKDTYAPIMKWDEFRVLVESLEKAQCANNSAPAILRLLAEEKQKRGEVAAATAFNYAASALQKELSK